MTKISYEKTKKGLPALWERGGGMTNTGNARIICGCEGQRLKPVYIRNGGQLSNSNHALFIVKEDYFIIDAYHERGDFSIDCFKIIEIDPQEEILEVEVVCCFSEGEWDKDPGFLLQAIDTAIAKALDYHCRKVYYALTE